MGGTKLDFALSGSSSATSGLRQDFNRIFGDNNSGGGSSRFLMPILVISGAVLAIVWLLRR